MNQNSYLDEIHSDDDDRTHLIQVTIITNSAMMRAVDSKSIISLYVLHHLQTAAFVTQPQRTMDATKLVVLLIAEFLGKYLSIECSRIRFRTNLRVITSNGKGLKYTPSSRSNKTNSSSSVESLIGRF